MASLFFLITLNLTGLSEVSKSQELPEDEEGDYFAIVDDMIASLIVRMKEDMEVKTESSVENEVDIDW